MSASSRLRRESTAVHHILCDLRRPPVGPPKCSCRVPEVGLALADLLDAIHRDEAEAVAFGVLPAPDVIKARDALEAAIERATT